MRPWILAEQTHAFVRGQKWEVAVLPFGATEPHNLHMPYGTDNFQVEAVGERACQKAYEAGAKVLLLPTMPFGVNTNHLQVPGAVALSVNPTTLLRIITDLAESLETQGINKLVLLNGHGGNELKPWTRELHQPHRRLFVRVRLVSRGGRPISAPFRQARRTCRRDGNQHGPGVFPRVAQAGTGGRRGGKAHGFDAINRGWVSITRPWHLVTTNTGLGDPSAATAAKGQRLMDIVVERLSAFFIDLAAAKMDETFPYRMDDAQEKTNNPKRE